MTGLADFDFKPIKSAVTAFFGCWALQQISGITVRNPLTVVFFVVLFWMALVQDKIRPYLISISAAYGIGMTFMLRNRITAGFDSKLFKLMSIVIVLCGMVCTCYILVGFAISVFSGQKRNDALQLVRKMFLDTKSSFTGTRVVLIIASLCFACWFPYFLYEYPGIMTADSLVQYAEFFGVEPVSNHHPIVHTLLIKFFCDIATLFHKDHQIGIALYTLFQMIFMAICCGVLVTHIRARKLQILATMFYALVPFNGVFVVTVWKDIIFAGITMLLLCCVIDLRESYSKGCSDEGECSDNRTTLIWFTFAVLGILFALFRSNAWYAFIVWTPFLLITFKKDIKRATCAALIVLVSVFIIKGPVMRNAGVAQPDMVESLAVPVQQTARMLVDDRHLEPKDQELIDKVIDTTYIKELYAPDFADNIKELVRAGHPEEIENNKSEYFRMYLRMNASNPGESIKAWYDLNGGYINPDVSYRVGDMDGIMGNEFGLFWDPKIGGKIVVKLREIGMKLGDFVPLYGLLWSIGTYTWLLVIATGICIYKRQGILCKLLLLMQVGTLVIAAPMVDFRYGYSIVMTMPLWLLYYLGKETEYGTAD
ncbi:MAG: hypothetical protein IJI01_05325 [Butyrivibrio sp.]|uniref:DUF6020 family protein n=1 Tax=Butyrivibrio sp. TaxID=28121 RepID=UPI0025BC727A|nr:DUF6020 family protein [Butyrivibrio sp.]MBQ6588079.1 hypothetical protein [Butyrivibrio sp.]